MVNKTKGGRRRWFRRPLWRDPWFVACFVLAVASYAAMLPTLLSYATNGFYRFLVVAYFFLVWFIICALISIPIGMTRGFEEARAKHARGGEDADLRRHRPSSQRARNPRLPAGIRAESLSA